MQIGVVDYGIGNIANVTRCLEYITKKEKILRVYNEKDILQCDKIILPGVGAFKSAMQHLEQMNLIEPIINFVKDGRYILGICLGMQLLFEKSFEFGEHNGLGLIKGNITKFDFTESNDKLNQSNNQNDNSTILHNKKDLKIPHIGWNKNFIQQKHKILSNLEDSFYLYFVHSYHANCNEQFILATCDYGIKFPSIVNKENIIGIQPHPERSHKIGFEIMQNFLNLKG